MAQPLTKARGARPLAERVSFTEFAQFDDIIAKLDDVQYALRLYSENGAPGHAFTKNDLKRAIAGRPPSRLHDASHAGL